MSDPHQLIDENKKVYNAIAGHFSNTRTLLWDDILSLKSFAKAGDHILDLGCGNGRLYQMFADLSTCPEDSGTEFCRIDYTGLDQSDGLLGKAKEKFPEANFVVGNMAEPLPFENHQFDLIYCIAAFHHLPTEEIRIAVLQEMKRILKPGGKVIMTNWNAESNWAKKKVETGDWRLGEDSEHFIVPWKNTAGEIKGLRHYWLLTPEHLEKIATQVGFTVEEQYYVSRGEKVEIHRGMNLISIFSL